MVTGNLIPNYVTSPTPQGLRRAMLSANVKTGKWNQFFDIQFVKGAWIAWYWMEVNLHNSEQLMSDTNQDGLGNRGTTRV